MAVGCTDKLIAAPLTCNYLGRSFGNVINPNRCPSHLPSPATSLREAAPPPKHHLFLLSFIVIHHHHPPASPQLASLCAPSATLQNLHAWGVCTLGLNLGSGKHAVDSSGGRVVRRRQSIPPRNDSDHTTDTTLENCLCTAELRAALHLAVSYAYIDLASSLIPRIAAAFATDLLFTGSRLLRKHDHLHLKSLGGWAFLRAGLYRFARRGFLFFLSVFFLSLCSLTFCPSQAIHRW